MTAPLTGCRILITRAAVQAADLARALSDLGACTEELATIRILPAQDLKALDEALSDLTVGCWWIFTSANGVKAVAARLAARDWPWPRDVKLAAVGPATAQALTLAAGRRPDLLPARHDGAALGVALAAHQTPPARMVLWRGNLASGELPEALIAAGFQVSDLETYTTEQAVEDVSGLAARLAAGEFAWITFASGSAFQHLLAALPVPDVLRQTRLASIGPRTSEVIVAAGFTVGAEAREATSLGIALAIAAAQTR
jgi:uroporphyrinogen-III synthase